jgi:anti-sigma B factor antagonist
MADLSIAVDDAGAWAIVRLDGEVDVASAPRLRERLLDLVAANRHHVAADLTDVTFLDSVGLGVLIGGLKRARSNGGDLVLVGPSGGVARVLELTGLLDVVKSVDTVDGLPPVDTQ